MKNKLKIILFLYVLIFTIPFVTRAAINFTNGKWETTFDCPEQVGSDYSPEQDTGCDGIIWKSPAANTEGNYAQITFSANNPAGGGFRGYRTWMNDGQNIGAGTVGLYFPSAQQEMWIRWTMRYESGFAWVGGTPQYDKHLYIYTDGTTQVIPEFAHGYTATAQGTFDYYQVSSGGPGGWTDVMGGGIGDGQFHVYEVYLKMDTNQLNGAGRIWVDGVLVAENISVDWSNGDVSAQQGWTRFNFISNQSSPLGGPYYVDVDDMEIYNQTPPNLDADRNAFIGPIGWVNENDEIAPSAPTGLNIL